MNTIETKVCGMTDTNNLSAVIATEPTYIGIIHYTKSKRHVEESRFSALLDLTKNVKAVLVVVNHPLEKLIKLLDMYPFDYVQLHGNEDYDYCKSLKSHLNKVQSPLRHGTKRAKIIKAFAVDSAFNFNLTNPFNGVTDLFLFDTKGKLKGGNGIQFDWQILSDYTAKHPFILSGGIGPNDAEQIKSFSHSQLAGIDLNSGFEITPGIKDIESLKAFKKALKYV